MDWFLYDLDLRQERVIQFTMSKVSEHGRIETSPFYLFRVSTHFVWIRTKNNIQTFITVFFQQPNILPEINNKTINDVKNCLNLTVLDFEDFNNN